MHEDTRMKGPGRSGRYRVSPTRPEKYENEGDTPSVVRHTAAARQAATRLLRCAPAFRVTHRDRATPSTRMAASEVAATSDPIDETDSRSRRAATRR